MSNGIYDILGKLAALTPKEEPKKSEPQKVYESVEAKGSILEGVKGIEKNLKDKYAELSESDVAAFLARGGQIQQGKYHKPRKSELPPGSKHIGTLGGAGKATNISGKSANTKSSGKPVVATEEDIASMGTDGMGNMGVLDEKAAPGQEGWIKKNKARFIDQYGKKKGLEVLYATAWKRSKQDESAGVCAECGLTETECTCVHEGEITHTPTGGIRHTKTDYPGYPTDDYETDPDDTSAPKAKGRPRKAQTKNPRVDPNAPKKGRGRPKAEKPPFSGKNAAGALTSMLYGKAPKSHPKGRVHRMDEGRMLDETGNTLEHILTRYASEVKQFETNPNTDLDRDLYDALYDYYAAIGEMPYGVQKARTGDPYEWVCQQLEKELGMYETLGTEGVEECGMGASSVAVAPTVDDLEEELNELARLAGLKIADEGNQFSGALAKAKASHQDTFDVDGKEYPVREAEVAVDGDEGEAEEELANVPDEKYATIKHITTQGDDLNRQKKQDPRTANRAANPLTNDYMQLEAKLAAEYESIKKVSK